MEHEDEREHRGVTRREFEELSELLAERFERIDEELQALWAAITPAPPPRPAVKAVLTIGAVMPGTITVDTTNETATLQFVDDHNDPTDAPAGAVVTFTSDDPAVTVAADPANPLVAKVTPVAVGSANIKASITGATEPSGAAFPDASAAVTVGPGPAAGDALVLSV